MNRPRVLGAIALVFYALHATELLLARPPQVLLWSCDVAALAVPVGLLSGSTLLTSAGCLMLITGLPLWIIDVSCGGDFWPASPLIHVGTPILALLAMRRLGLPGRSWLLAIALTGAVTLASRFAGAPEQNVNLAFTVPRGFEATSPPHAVYLALVGGAFAVVTLASHLALRRLGFALPDK